MSDERTWSAVDEYVEQRLIGEDPALEQALRDAVAAELPMIAVTPSQGKQLHLLARSLGARRILEIGTLGGYSAIWLARALAPGGRLVTLEVDARCAEVAAASIARAGLADIVEIRLGPALETLPLLAAERPEPFDFVFIDADKRHTPDYFQWALQLTRPGALIVADNVIRYGGLVDPANESPDVLGNRRLHELLADDRSEIGQRVSATTIQTVGAKGYDGFTLALVNP
ncbi:MAG TPA: O-methyltransferase [Solirubrobacteraceae bacterium]|nr:O-methyltransferase [Solirubrobacteraceae bacterium]